MNVIDKENLGVDFLILEFDLIQYTIHSVLTGCVIIVEMAVTPSLFIK